MTDPVQYHRGSTGSLRATCATGPKDPPPPCQRHHQRRELVGRRTQSAPSPITVRDAAPLAVTLGIPMEPEPVAAAPIEDFLPRRPHPSTLGHAMAPVTPLRRVQRRYK